METVFKGYATLRGANAYAKKYYENSGVILSIVLIGGVYMVGK